MWQILYHEIYQQNSDDKKVRYTMNCYIMHMVLLAIILMLVISIIYYNYAKHRSKLKKHIIVLTIQK